MHRYTQGITQPCLWDQRLAVELWQAPASSGWPFSRQDRTDSQNVQVWSGPARLEDQKFPEAACWRGKVQQRLQQRLKIYAMHIPDIYLSYKTAQQNMLFKGLCDVPRLVMHKYILVQTSRDNFIVFSSVKTQFIEEHKNLGICRSYTLFILVIYQCWLKHGITLEKIITTNVKTHWVYWKLGWMLYIHSKG
jgi:hypothetical protein